MIRQANIDDLNKLVELHLNNFDKNELSIILGEDFIREFYKLALIREDTNINVVIYNGEIVAFSLVFFNYGEFEKEFKNKSIKYLIKYFIQNIFNFSNLIFVYKSIKSKKFKKIVPKEIYNYYVGTFIINKSFIDMPIVIVKFYEAYSKNIKLLTKYSKLFWGSCRESNKNSLRLLKKKGMKTIIKIYSFPEDILVTIKKDEGEK